MYPLMKGPVRQAMPLPSLFVVIALRKNYTFSIRNHLTLLWKPMLAAIIITARVYVKHPSLETSVVYV